MNNTTSCILCGQTDFEEYLTCKDHTTTQEAFSIIKCKGCGFMFTNPQPSQSEIGKYYLSDKYISHSGSKRNLFEFIYHFARSFALQSKRKIIEQHSNDKCILDYGCGTGEFLQEMKNHGWKIAGVEPSESARKKASLLTKETIYKNISEIEEGHSYNVITLWHVLEHLHNPKEILSWLHHSISDSGSLIIAVPNHESYDAAYYQSFWAAYDVPRHLWHFSKKDIKSLLGQTGFKLKEVLPMKLDSFYVSLLSESYKNQAGLKIVRSILAITKGLQSNLSARKNMNYSSLIYIAEK